jgi:divalent metal cation (Fe/Co/Zn/Cd) transporter
MKKFIILHRSELSHGIGVGIGFFNFYVLYYSWNVSWEISFAIAFVMGFFASKALDHYVGREFDKHEAEKISEYVEEFEEK